MPNESLPTRLDPFRFADNGNSLDGILPVRSMARLVTLLHSDQSEVAITLEFGLDEEKIRYVKGHAKTDLILQCQRCMGSLEFAVNIEILSAIVTSEEDALKLPNRYDPLIVTDGMIVVSDIIEDELMLNLPIVPMHDLESCSVKLPLVASSEDTQEFDRQSPFKVIELLRSKKNSPKNS